MFLKTIARGRCAALTTLVLTCAATSPRTSAATELPRRGVLGMGVFGFLGFGTRTPTTPPAPAAPPVVNVASPAMLEYRSAGLTEILKRIRSPDVPNESGYYEANLSAFERMIIEDWSAQDPEGRRFIFDDLATFDELRRVYAASWKWSAKTLRTFRQSTDRGGIVRQMRSVDPELQNKIWSMRDEILGHVSQWPWSTYDWTVVFLDRIKSAEQELARTFGPEVDVTEVYQLTADAINPVEGLISAIANPRFAKPLYSTETVEALARAFEIHCAPLGRAIRQVTSDTVASPAVVRVKLVNLAVRSATYHQSQKAPIRFRFEHVRTDSATPEQLAPRYLGLRDRLTHMLANAHRLDSSQLKTTLIREIMSALDELDAELTTLPQRLAADALRLPRRHLPDVLEPNASSVETADDPAIEAASAVHWAGVLRTIADRLSVTWPGETPATDASPSNIEECGAKLDGEGKTESPAQIEYQPGAGPLGEPALGPEKLAIPRDDVIP